MKIRVHAALAVLVMWGGAGIPLAQAQSFSTLGQAPTRVRPPVSPYVNLNAGSASSLYGIIRPQVDANHSIQELQQGVNRLNADGSLQPQMQTGLNTGVPMQTGHSAGFFYYGNYYPPAFIGGGGMTTTGGTGIGTGAYGGANGFGLGGAGQRAFYSGSLNQGLVR